MNRTPWGRCLGERKAGAGQAGMTPEALTWESVSVRVPFTKEEERIKTADNRAHLCAKHCSHVNFIAARLYRFCYCSIIQMTKLRYREIIRDHTPNSY